MIAAIRVRFTPTPATQMWSDASFANWLNPTIPFSLGHYWRKSSFGFADLNFQIFPSIVMDDPRLQLSPADRMNNGKSRQALVNGVSARVTASFKPDWSKIDGMLIWFAQPTDLFGGGAFPVPLPSSLPDPFGQIVGLLAQAYKDIPVAVSDIASPFSTVCQELGHAYGFEHPLDRNYEDYGDPYDSMASAWYGGVFNSGFTRAADPRLPMGTVVDGIDQQAVMGPYISAAHLAADDLPRLGAAGLVVNVPPSYATGAASFRLHALDDAIERYPTQALPVVAVIPPDMPGGDTHYLELRRAAGYDAGLRVVTGDSSRPPVGVVIHKYDATRKRVVYLDTLPLVDNRGDRDYHMFGGGGFTVRVTSIGAAMRTVNLTVGGRNFWRQFGLDLEAPRETITDTSQTAPQSAEVSPCFMYDVGTYYYHHRYVFKTYTLVANSFGYERPTYTWSLNGVVLDPSLRSAKVPCTASLPGPTGVAVAAAMVDVAYTVGADRLEFSCDPVAGNFSLLVGVRVAETSPGVLKNVYEDRTLETSLNIRGVSLVWDDNYKRRQKECRDALWAVNMKRIPRRKLGVPVPDDRFGPRVIEEILRDILDVSTSVADAVVDGVAKVGIIIVGGINQRR